MRKIVLRVFEALINPYRKNVISVSDDSIHISIQCAAKIGRQRSLICDGGNFRHVIGQWLETFRLNSALVHEAGVVVAHLLRNAVASSSRRTLNKTAYAIAG